MQVKVLESNWKANQVFLLYACLSCICSILFYLAIKELQQRKQKMKILGHSTKDQVKGNARGRVWRGAVSARGRL